MRVSPGDDGCWRCRSTPRSSLSKERTAMILLLLMFEQKHWFRLGMDSTLVVSVLEFFISIIILCIIIIHSLTHIYHSRASYFHCDAILSQETLDDHLPLHPMLYYFYSTIPLTLYYILEFPPSLLLSSFTLHTEQKRNAK